jgi:hypothetical protein
MCCPGIQRRVSWSRTYLTIETVDDDLHVVVWEINQGADIHGLDSTSCHLLVSKRDEAMLGTHPVVGKDHSKR